MNLQLKLTPEPRENVRFESPPRFRVLGVPVNAVQIPDVISRIEQWIESRSKAHYIAVTGMHGIAESWTDDGLHAALNSADLVVPDGMPLVWLARRHGYRLKRRVYGPELMEAFCRQTGPRYRHFFYGGQDGVAERLADSLRERHGIVVAGTFAPPFRALTDEEEGQVRSLIDNSSPDVLWVGLSTPKQENWMYNFSNRLTVPVMLGVGAAFDIHSGRTRQAPEWMRENGLEWLFRLLTEPRRLGRRYLILVPKAAGLVLLELT